MKRPGLVLILILVVGAALRIDLALSTVYIYDEAADWVPLARSLAIAEGETHLPLRGEHHPALPAYFIRLGALVFGANELGYRCLGIVAGLLLIVVGYVLARRWAGTEAGLATAAILAVAEYTAQVSSLAIQKPYYLLFLALSLFAFTSFLLDPRGRALYASAAALVAAYWCEELALLAVPAYLVALLFSERREWLRRREPWIAALIVVAGVAPDLLAALGPHVGAEARGPGDHLSRLRGLGLTYRPSLLYLRDPLRLVLGHFGFPVKDSRPEYAALGPILGGLLLTGTALGAWKAWRHRDAVGRTLALVFASWFGLFTVLDVGPGSRPLLDIGFNWIDPTLFPAAVLTGALIARARGRWRGAVVAAALAGSAFAVWHLARDRVEMDWIQLRAVPWRLDVLDDRWVDVTVRHNACMRCDQDPQLVFDGFDVRDDERMLGPVAAAQDVDGTNPRAIRVRAVSPPDGARRTYALRWQVHTSDGKSHLRYAYVHTALEGEPALPEPFW